MSTLTRTADRPGERADAFLARVVPDLTRAAAQRLLEAGAAKRGMRISGGELDTERMARVLLDEYRAGKLGRFTLETPEGTSI